MLFQFLRSAVLLTLVTLRVRPWRTSCEIVGTRDGGSFRDRDEMGPSSPAGWRPAGATVGVFISGHRRRGSGGPGAPTVLAADRPRTGSVSWSRNRGRRARPKSGSRQFPP